MTTLGYDGIGAGTRVGLAGPVNVGHCLDFTALAM